MNYKRYSLGNFGPIMWIECTACGTRDKPFYVWQLRDRQSNFELPVGAVMQHEVTAHPSNPTRRKR
jgi:hypothetical protein